MSITSISFVLFIIIVFLAYYLLPKRLQWVILLTSSYAFYMFYDLKAMLFMVFTTAITFYSAILIDRINQKYASQLKDNEGTLTAEQKLSLKAACKKRTKTVIAAALVACFGLLAIFKYYDFTIININKLFNLLSVDTSFEPLNLLLPLGISFYIFQSAGYVIDVYRGKYQPDRNIFKFALFVSFFPQIIQGPIGRYDRLAKQLYAKRSMDYTQLKYGIQLMLWGFFKKMVIADRVAVLVDHVFGNYAKYGGAVIFTAIIFYCIQIYCDFSGGIDIVRGVAQGLGIYLDKNFERPFFAKSISEFWRRWHITLGAWMKDYLFYSLSLSKAFGRLGKAARKKFGNRVGKLLPAYLVTFIVFTVIGLWHGSSGKYIVFGFWNGGLITLSMIFAPLFESVLGKLRIPTHSFAWQFFCIFRTFLLVCIGRYFTRAATLMISLQMLKRTFTIPQFSQLYDGTLLKLGLDLTDFVLVFLSVVVLLIVGILQERGHEVRKLLEEKSFRIQWAVMFLAMLVIVFFGIYRGDYIASKFIYAQF